MSNITPARLLTQYYRAIDNYSLESMTTDQVVRDLARIAAAIDAERGGLIPMEEVARVRQLVGLCNYGANHWQSECRGLHAHTETDSE